MSWMPDPIEGGLTDDERARLAGWDGEGAAPYVHSAPPEIDPQLGNNGIPLPEGAVELSTAGDGAEPLTELPDPQR